MNKVLQFPYLIILFQYLYISNTSAINVSEQMSMAKNAYIANQYEKAISHLEFILKEKPNYVDAYFLKGKCYVERDQYNLALDDFNQASNRNPQESEFLYYKGMCEWKLKRVNACIQSIEKALVYDPDNFLAYRILGSMYYDLDMVSLAKENFDKAIDIQPDFSVNYFNKNKVSSYSEDYKIALKALNRDVKSQSTSYLPYFYRGILKAIGGDNWGAYIDFNHSANLDVNQPVMYYYKGYVEYNIKKFDEALSDLHKYSRKYADDQSVNNLMGVIKEIMSIKIVVEDEENNSILTFAEKMPEFKGGLNAMYDYLNRNIQYPSLAQNEKIEGKVVLQFVIDTKGYVNNIEVLKAIGGGCEDEAIRVVNQMPKWNPGKQNGRSVSVKYTLPISFKLETY